MPMVEIALLLIHSWSGIGDGPFPEPLKVLLRMSGQGIGGGSRHLSRIEFLCEHFDPLVKRNGFQKDFGARISH